MAPTMLHVFSELSALATDEDIKNVILTNYSDIPSTTEAATRLQNMQTSNLWSHSTTYMKQSTKER